MSNVLELKDVKPVPDIIHKYLPSLRDGNVPLVIDNGSYQCRVGWATSENPLLTFKNLIAKPRKERGKKDGEAPVTPPIQIGNDILNIEAVRFQLKTQFDRNVVTHFEAQEQVFDYTFSHLGINTEGNVSHPIVLTEAFANPNYCRHLMSELLFECYGVPSLAYGVDALFSFYHNSVGDTGVVINCGFHTIHIIPIVRGEAIFHHARRINIGGFQMISFLHRLLQLKYPVHLNAITPSRAEELLVEHGHIALHYQEELSKWTDPEHYDAQVRKIQLPYSVSSTPVTVSAEAQKERKRELSKRLLEINARRREERLAEDEEQLNQLLALQDLLDEGEEEEFYRALPAYDIRSYEELQRQINQLNRRIEGIKQKIVTAATNDSEPSTVGPEDKISTTTTTSNTKVHPPLDPAAFEAWLDDFKKKRSDILSAKMSRKQRKTDMARRKTVAAQERMRLISHLAKKEKGNDDFGMRDEDWDVYKTISKEGNDSDSEIENEKLLEIEEVLREFDPSFCGSSANDGGVGVCEAHQLHVGIERLRAPELMFQPFMMGNIEAGVAECLEYVLKQFPPADQLALANNVFVTGGCASFSGFKERLSRELLEMRPFQSTHQVNMASNPSLDAWRGARQLAADPNLSNYLITKQDYSEMGGDYIREHRASNKYFKSLTPIDTSLLPAVDGNVIKEEIIDIEFDIKEESENM